MWPCSRNVNVVQLGFIALGRGNALSWTYLLFWQSFNSTVDISKGVSVRAATASNKALNTNVVQSNSFLTGSKFAAAAILIAVK